GRRLGVLRRRVTDGRADPDDGAPDGNGRRRLSRPRLALCETDPAADRILIRKELRGELLVDDRGLAAGRSVRVVEHPAAPNPHAHRVEEPRTDGHDSHFGGALLRLARGPSLDVDAAAAAAE